MPPDNLVIPGPSVVLASGQADIDRAARARRSINTKRWRRDAGIAEIVDYFDRPNKNSIDQLNAKEYNVIVEQANRCRKDFVYAARNYFWITNKDTGDQLFSLWESQELILEEIIRLKARGRAQKLIVLKARQLGISTLVEALIAWNTMFFENTNAIIVSRDGSHASYLFNTIVLHIYDLLPWWLKPMIDSRKQDEGLIFDNPDQVARRVNPGLMSRIDIAAATQQGGIGQGRRISAAHICLVPQSLIKTQGGIVKMLKEVAPGDLVLTSSGQMKPVKRVVKSDRRNELTSQLWMWGEFAPLETTRDHKVLTPRGMREAGSIDSGEYVSMPVKPIIEGVVSKTFVRFGTGGRHKKKIGHPYDVPMNYDWGWLFGLYLAEGSIGWNRRLTPGMQACRVDFSIHQKEIKWVVDGIAKCHPSEAKQQRRKNSKGVVLTANSGAMARFILSNFGNKDEKRIPEWVWGCGKDFCLGLVKGYIQGDGHIKPEVNEIRATSVRLSILIQMRDIIASLGCGWSSLFYRGAGEWYGRNCKEAWTLQVNGSCAARLREMCEWDTFPESPALHWMYSQDRRFIEIQVAERSEAYSQEFYDLEVDAPEHDFCTVQCCVKNSELGDWPEDIARGAIEGDLRHALAERSVRTFAVIESTAKGAGTYYHGLWNSSIALADKASWSTIFLPWFFEKTRFVAPEQGWHPVKPELELRERIKDEWVRCDNEECGRWKEASDGAVRLEDTHCPYCKAGALRSFVLVEGQLRFIWEERINAEKDKQSAKEFKQELASTATEAFQISGYQLFAPDIQDYVDRCVRIPQAKGFIDAKGRFHGVKVILDGENRISQIRCWDEHCLFDHRYDPTPLWIWEFPRPGADYCCGADVAEGLGGDADYSVGWMNRIGQPPAPDVHVATYRSNAIDPISFAFVLNVFGRWYNEAMMCIEYNKFDTCANNVRYQFQYPNLFRWKHLDNARDPLANKFHWYTQYNTKPRLWQTAVKRLRAGLWVPRDETFASEIKTFQKEDYEDRGGSHASGFHDDTCVPAGTLVTTSSGIKAIEDIRVGDRVLTHQGRYMPVTNTMSKHEPKRLFRVKAMGRPDLLLTGDHKMLLWKKEIQTRAKINKPFRRKNSQRWKTVNMKQVCWTHYIDPDWISIDSATYDPLKYATCSVAPKAVVDVSNINISLYVPEGYRVHRKNGKVGFTSGKPVHTMRHVTEKIPVDINLLRIMGYFAAEGTAGAHHISFASHDREAPFRDWVMHYLRSLGVHCGVRKSAINGSSVWCSSIPLRSFFCEFGKRENRRLPDWTELLPKEKQKQIIVGYLLGDGCFRDKTRRISAATISRELGRQLWSMSLRCGWATAIKLRKGQNGHQEQWNIIYGPDASREIRALIEKEFLDCKRSLREGMGNRTFSQVRINDGFLVGKITKVEEIPFCGPVYDITVDEDHSFVANGTVVSNCISAMISLYCSHDMDWSEDSGTVVMRSEGTVESSGDYHMKCRCGHEWDTDNPDSYTHPHTGCPKCRNIILSAKRLSAKNGHSVHMDWDLMEREITPEDNPRDYNSL